MMTIRQVARCPICGNIVEVLHAGAGTFTISVLAMHTPWVINADKLLLE